jgi:hypothetical protein
LVYTGITRGKKLVVVIGQRKALVYSRESGTPCGYILEDSVAVEVFAPVRDDYLPGRV